MGFFDKIKQGLTKTRAALSEAMDDVFSANEIEEDFYDDLEETLILADLGRETALRVVMKLRHRINNNNIKKTEKARKFSGFSQLSITLRINCFSGSSLSKNRSTLIDCGDNMTATWL